MCMYVCACVYVCDMFMYFMAGCTVKMDQLWQLAYKNLSLDLNSNDMTVSQLLLFFYHSVWHMNLL